MTKPPKETSPCKFCVSLNSVFLRRPKGKFKAQKGRDNGLRCQSDPTREAARPPRKHCSGSWALGGVYSPVVIEKYTELLDEQQRSVTAGAGPTPRAFFGNWSLSLLHAAADAERTTDRRTTTTTVRRAPSGPLRSYNTLRFCLP